ncbi:MAG: CocE/NonD family hydrolase [Patescibacteria group bacterium]
MFLKKIWIFLVFLPLLSCGHLVKGNYRALSPAKPIGENLFSYEKQPLGAEEKLMKKGRNYEIFKITFPSYVKIGKNDKVIARYYKLKGNEPRPVVIIFPISGGGYQIERHTAELLNKHGYHAIILERKKDLFRIDNLSKIAGEEELEKELAYSKEVFRQTVIDGRRVIDWLETKSEIAAEKIGVSGVSRGGIFAGLLLIAEPRLKSGVIIAGGTDIAHTLAYSKEPGIKKVRNIIKKRFDLSDEQYREKAAKFVFGINAYDYQPPANPEKILMIHGLWDKMVPKHSAECLREALGNPDIVWLPAGHLFSILFTPYMDNLMIEYFTKNLKGNR